jgi:ATP-dependent DNA helicase RecG
MNPGGLYGQARPENFPHVNDYRNSVVAEMMKNLNYVNMFNHGVSEVQDLLKENQSPIAEFNVNLVTAFSVIVRGPKDDNTSNIGKDDPKELSERQSLILGLFKENGLITIQRMTQKVKVSEKTIKRELATLQEMGILAREGGRKEGRWVIIVK